jgi:hypothetical protein
LGDIDGSNFGRGQGSKEKEIRRALSQPLQALWPPARFYSKVSSLPDLFPAAVAFGRSPWCDQELMVKRSKKDFGLRIADFGFEGTDSCGRFPKSEIRNPNSEIPRGAYD